MTTHLDDGHLEPFLTDQLENSNGFQMSLHTYKERPKEERTYERVCETWKKWMQQQKERDNLLTEHSRGAQDPKTNAKSQIGFQPGTAQTLQY